MTSPITTFTTAMEAEMARYYHGLWKRGPCVFIHEHEGPLFEGTYEECKAWIIEQGIRAGLRTMFEEAGVRTKAPVDFRAALLSLADAEGG